MKKNRILSICALMLLASCGSKQSYEITSLTGERILVVDAENKDSDIQQIIDSYKVQLDNEMNVVIGESEYNMDLGFPESPLTNLTSDVMMLLEKEHTGVDKPDLAIMNVFGHRAPIAKGDITVGTIFKTYPFDNMLVVSKLKGEYLEQAFDSYAQMGGYGISSNAKLIIKDKKIKSATLNGKPIDKNKIYTIVTLEYLAEGNDGMDAMKNSESVTETGIKLRDYMLDYVNVKTKAGQKVVSRNDGRIIIE